MSSCQLHISLTRTAHIYLELHFCVEPYTKKAMLSFTLFSLFHHIAKRSFSQTRYRSYRALHASVTGSGASSCRQSILVYFDFWAQETCMVSTSSVLFCKEKCPFEKKNPKAKCSSTIFFSTCCPLKCCNWQLLISPSVAELTTSCQAVMFTVKTHSC